MGPSPIQLSFTLRTSPNCKTVHLVGSWDGYKGQLPLSKDGSKAGAWKGTFRFQGTTLVQGSRYWYYYIMDGYHVSHDPGKPYTTEPTTGRKLNILDVPAGPGESKSSSSSSSKHVSQANSNNRRSSMNVAKGRPVSPSRIVSPRPVKPGSTVDKLTSQLKATQLTDSDTASESESEFESSDDDGRGSDVPSLTSSRSSSSSRSSTSTSSGCHTPNSLHNSEGSTGSRCSCNRFGITRKGNRVRLDCGGARCGYSDSECSDSEPEVGGCGYGAAERATRRQGVVVRGGAH